jgi:hypothetical protein
LTKNQIELVGGDGVVYIIFFTYVPFEEALNKSMTMYVHPSSKDLSPPSCCLNHINLHKCELSAQLSLEQLMRNLGTNLRIEGKEHDPAGN